MDTDTDTDTDTGAGAGAGGGGPHAGRLVRRWRLRRGLTQRELAERLGLSQGRLSQIEAAPTLQLGALERIARALGGALRVELGPGGPDDTA